VTFIQSTIIYLVAFCIFLLLQQEEIFTLVDYSTDSMCVLFKIISNTPGVVVVRIAILLYFLVGPCLNCCNVYALLRNVCNKCCL